MFVHATYFWSLGYSSHAAFLTTEGHRSPGYGGHRRRSNRRSACRRGRWRPAHFIYDHFRARTGARCHCTSTKVWDTTMLWCPHRCCRRPCPIYMLTTMCDSPRSSGILGQICQRSGRPCVWNAVVSIPWTQAAA